MLKSITFIQFNLIILMIMVLTNCQDQYQDNKEKWGMRSIEYEHKISFRDTSYVDEVIFTPQISSDNYELRIYFTNLNLEDSTSFFENKSERILRLLDGFEYSIFDSKTNLRMLTNTVTHPLRTKNYSFNSKEPLFMWMDTKVELKKDVPYKVAMIIPPKRDIDEKFYNVVFVIGIAHSNFYL